MTQKTLTYITDSTSKICSTKHVDLSKEKRPGLRRDLDAGLDRRAKGALGRASLPGAGLVVGPAEELGILPCMRTPKGWQEKLGHNLPVWTAAPRQVEGSG